MSSVFPGDLKLYYVEPELRDLGLITLPIKLGHEIKAYNVERTVCDVLRSRRQMDDQTAASAIKNYAVRPQKDFAALGEMQTYLEVLL